MKTEEKVSKKGGEVRTWSERKREKREERKQISALPFLPGN